jgi:CysZ protein
MTNRQIFLEEFKIGLKSYWKSISIIFNNKLIYYFLIPLVINIVLLFFGFKYIFELTEYSTQLFKNWIDFDGKEFWGHQYLNEFFIGFITVLFYIVFFIAYMLISGNIIMILMSPVLSLVSEKIDKIITGKVYSFEIKQLMKDILRGTIISVRNSIIEIILMILMLFVSFIPVIGLISPVILFITSSYFFGFSFLDYTLERNQLSVRESIKFVRNHKGLAISNGTVFSLFLFIPFCGSSLAAFFSIISVGAGTLSINQLEEKNKNLYGKI